MRFSLVLLIISIWLTGCSQKYFIVRHAEKAQPSESVVMNTPNDPPLTDAGVLRAKGLAERLAKEMITLIYSTHTVRTLATAKPTATASHCEVLDYVSADSAFIGLLKHLRGNVLIVGHSNTVDDLVNGLTGKQILTDLGDSEYDNLFIIRRKGKKYTYFAEKFGVPSAN
jgi:phosphohistidine phosphatase SixA